MNTNTDTSPATIQTGSGIILDDSLPGGCFSPLRRNDLPGFSTWQLWMDAPARVGRFPWIACEVEVSGRKVRRDVTGLRGVAVVRVRVVFVGDGEPDEVTSGWMHVDGLWAGYGLPAVGGADLGAILAD